MMNDASETRARFATTSWTLVRNAHDRHALERLLAMYWSPVYAYIRRTGRRPEEAAELTQAFMAEVLIGRDLPARASPERGRFRTFLLTALDRFLIDQGRRDRVRRPQTPVLPLSPEVMAQQGEPEEDAEPQEAFERQWAAAVLHQTIDRLRLECEHDGLIPHWRAFEARVVHPALRQVAPTPTADLAAELGVEAQRVADMVQTVKRRLRRLFIEVVAETVDDPARDRGRLDDEVERVRARLGL